MEFNIEELRKQRRPLWMTNLAVESMAEILVGAGGDIRTDRLSVDSDRMTGKEIEKECDPKDVEFLLAGREVGEDYIS
ncbi:MAG: hypothetical protein ACLQBD_00510 [Syntrophobacteraceae bacterium]